MKRLLALSLLLGSATANAATVESANNNFSYLPTLANSGIVNLTPEAITSIHQLVIDKECKIAGSDKRDLNMTVPFAAHYNPDGSLDKIVIKRIGCARAEGILGGVLLEMFGRGEFKPTGANQDGWYRSQLSFENHV